MEKRLKAYLAYLEKLTEEKEQQAQGSRPDRTLLEEILTQIAFFQHERLVHLIVTMTFALMTVGSLVGCVLSGNLWLLVLTLMFLVLLIPYIRHYYILENGVQKMYRYYDVLSGATFE